ncbi:MAG TPA: hypothetical protein VGH33_27995 [Isosphaeraceae bacterium]
MPIARVRGFVLLAMLSLASGRAQAQFRGGRGFGGYGGYGGYGGLGFGYGFSPYYYGPGHPEAMLYRQAMLRASRATMGPVMHDVYAGNPAAYIYHLRDPGHLDGMDAATRRRIEAEIARFSDGPPGPDQRRVAAGLPPPPPVPGEAVPPAPQPAAARADQGAKGRMP